MKKSWRGHEKKKKRRQRAEKESDTIGFCRKKSNKEPQTVIETQNDELPVHRNNSVPLLRCVV